MKEQFLKAVADTIRITIYDSNRAQTPTSGTITLSTPSGGVLQTAAAVTVNPTTGEMTYALTSTHTVNSGLNFKAVWAYLLNGVTYYQTQLFDIVKSMLAISITDDDLYNELESLRKSNYQASTTATAGAAGSITDTKRREQDDFWKGGIVKIISGTGIGQSRDVTGFTQSTGVFTITPVWGTNPDNTSVYVVVKSFSNKIQAAFDKICTMLYDKGKRHQLILESSQISQILIYKTLQMICLDFTDEADDKWDRLATVYKEEFEKAFNNMKLDYDEDDSGAIAGEEEQTSVSSIRIGRA